MQLSKDLTIKDWLGEDNQLGIDIWTNKYQHNGESFYDWLMRVSGHDNDVAQMIWEKKFLFGGRILAMRGVDDGTKYSFASCYFLPAPEDSLESIYDTCKYLAKTYAVGGGCGTDISKLSPEGAKVNDQAKSTSGAVSFMETFSQVTQQICQHGRRGALMISIDCTHPDLEKFITIKTDLNKVNFANISVKISDKFMEAVEHDIDWELFFNRPETGECITKLVKAKDIFELLCKTNWDYAEPGILFWDTINNYNLQSENPEFEYGGTNPCGELPLPPFGACLLGSLNLSAFVCDNGMFNTTEFERCVELAIRALNQVQEEGAFKHPLQQQKDCASDWKQTGLGIMGLADMLIKMEETYGSKEAITICDQIGHLMARVAIKTSADIAKFSGTYPKWTPKVCDSTFYKTHIGINEDINKTVHTYGLRNSQLMAIAPTGSLSTMLGISGGIEPIFANSYTRTTKTLHDEDVIYKVYTPIVDEYMKAHNLTDESELPSYFVTSATIPVKDRIAMQSIWQKHIDGSISSTVNLPNSATIDNVKEIYMSAWKAGLKGITVYRSGCAREGILNTGDSKSKQTEKNLPLKKNIGLERHLTTGCGSLHICAFFNENGDLKNTYLSKGSSGGCNNFMIGLSRMISLCARNGSTINEIIDQLNSCGTCPSYAVRRATKGDTSVGSCCPVAIGNALKDMWKEVNGQELTIEPSNVSKTLYTPIENQAISCPECGGILIHEMGCVTCKSCGYSKCG